MGMQVHAIYIPSRNTVSLRDKSVIDCSGQRIKIFMSVANYFSLKTTEEQCWVRYGVSNGYYFIGGNQHSPSEGSVLYQNEGAGNII